MDLKQGQSQFKIRLKFWFRSSLRSTGKHLTNNSSYFWWVIAFSEIVGLFLMFSLQLPNLEIYVSQVTIANQIKLEMNIQITLHHLVFT